MKYKYIQVLCLSANFGNLKKEYKQVEEMKPEI